VLKERAYSIGIAKTGSDSLDFMRTRSGVRTSKVISTAVYRDDIETRGFTLRGVGDGGRCEGAAQVSTIKITRPTARTRSGRGIERDDA
jgi:hypothetical protein